MGKRTSSHFHTFCFVGPWIPCWAEDCGTKALIREPSWLPEGMPAGREEAAERESRGIVAGREVERQALELVKRPLLVFAAGCQSTVRSTHVIPNAPRLTHHGLSWPITHHGPGLVSPFASPRGHFAGRSVRALSSLQAHPKARTGPAVVSSEIPGVRRTQWRYLHPFARQDYALSFEHKEGRNVRFIIVSDISHGLDQSHRLSRYG